MRKALTTLAAIAILAASCSSDDPPAANATPNTDPVVIEIDGDQVTLTSSLSGFADCNALLDHLRAEGAERVGPYGFNDGWYGGVWPGGPGLLEDDTDLAVEEVEAPTSGSTATDGNEGAAADLAPDLAEGVDFSGTNVQETGVDEADIVKTDGERIFIVASGQLIVVDVATRTVVGSVAVPSGDRAELFIDGDDVLLINQSYGDYAVAEDGVVFPDVAATEAAPAELEIVEDPPAYPVVEPAVEPAIEPDVEPVAIEEPFPIDVGFEGSSTTITRLSVEGNNPRILETLAAEGDYVSARAVDGTARIILRSNPQYNFPFVYPQGDAGADRAEESNREALLDSTLSDWLPEYTMLDADGSQTGEGLLVPCEQVHAPTEFAGFGILSVLTVDVNGTIDPTSTSSVLAPGEVVYASPDSVYVATTSWFDTETLDVAREQIVENVTTSIHRFDISSATSSAYTASGSVPGLIRDSFSFSEQNGYLRVVTTTGNTWDDTSESWIRILEETDGALIEVGAVGDMGNGEAVQSVRFQGDVGYVVTFRQVDPLYTVDLSDPTNPVVRGELKIPGFSSYLHPIGDGLVIGVGSDADEESGQVTGSKVSLFDVSDLDNPSEVATWIGPDSWNNVGWDTHAFLWWAPERLAAVPINTWDNGEQWAGIVLLRVEDDSITEVGRIDHADPNATIGETDCRQLSESDLSTTDQSEFSSELEHMLADNYGLVLDCANGQAQTASGFECSADSWIAEEASNIGIDVQGTLVSCWPIGNGVPQISRSIVLPGNELWTVSSLWGWLGGESPANLQVNDLQTFERLESLDL